MTREHSSSGQLAGPDGFDKWADPSATFRLHEGISNPSRAEDQAHLHRLQKSSTKPRSGAFSCSVSEVCLGALRMPSRPIFSSIPQTLVHHLIYLFDYWNCQGLVRDCLTCLPLPVRNEEPKHTEQSLKQLTLQMLRIRNSWLLCLKHCDLLHARMCFFSLQTNIICKSLPFSLCLGLNVRSTFSSSE